MAEPPRSPAEGRFERTVISRDMKDPMQFTLLGDGRIVVVDRMGTVHVIKKDGTSVPTVVPIYAVGSGKPNWEDGMILKNAVGIKLPPQRLNSLIVLPLV